MSTATKAGTAVSYAALILADANIAITPEKLQILLKAAGVEDIEPIWTTLFAKVLENKNIKEILTTITTSGPANTSPEVIESETQSENGDADGEQDSSKDDAEEDSDEDLGNLFDL